MRTWLKAALVVAVIALFLMIWVPRLWVKNSTAHLVIDGRVTDDFKLYFGPGGRMLLREGVKPTRRIFLYTGNYTDPHADECAPGEFIFPPFTALSKHAPPRCAPGKLYQASAQGNRLIFRTATGHQYEVTWQPPNR